MDTQNKKPLYMYVIGVAVVWAIILGLMWFLGYTPTFHEFTLVCGGFWIGMLAMYTAVHIYKW